MIRKSSILITGASGEVGSELIKSFSQTKNSNIITLDLHPLESSVSHLVSDKITGNILDTNLLDQINLDFEIKEIYHLAAILSTRAEREPKIAHNVNVNGSINLLELALKQSKNQNKRVRFFFPSSIAVYGVADSNEICSENNFQNPMTVYGCNKLYIERLGIYYSKYCDQLIENSQLIDFRSLRFPGLLSASTVPSGGTSDFIPEMWHAIINDKIYECFVEKNSRLPFLAMPDAISAIQRLMDMDMSNIKSRVYNVTSFSLSSSQFYSKIKRHFPNAKITYKINQERQKIIDSWPDDVDDSLATNEWGWQPYLDLDDTINDYLLQENKE